MSTTTTTTAVAVVASTVAKPSIFSRIKAKLELWAKELEKDEPKVEVVALETIEVLAPLAESVIDEVDPALAPLVAPFISKVQAGLAALTTTIEDSGTQPTVTSVVDSINTNLASIESAVGIESTGALAITGQISSELGSITTALFPPSTTTAPATPTPTADTATD